MKLYLLSQNENNDYDTYDSCIVCAESEQDAKTIMPDGKPFEPSGFYGSWAHTLEGVQCKEIGTANDNIQRGVVLSSFNAG